MAPTLPFTIDGRYAVLAEVGRGAHAVVYRARDLHTERDVAIKMLRPEVVGSVIGARFAQEIRITATLAHPHVAQVHDTGEWDGRPYFVSTLATGASLDARLERERPLPVDDAISIACDVAGALHYAHQQGVVHRDVKPENILLTDDGALLGDFGIARAVGLITEQALITSTGIAVGTLLYMSPEQICAERNIDGRSDQYSLALVLYEMLAGVRPHESASVEGLRVLRLAGQQHSVRLHRPAVPEHLDAAILRALSPAPADRFASCAEFARALTSAAARTTATNVAAVPSPNRSRWIGVAAAAIAVTTLVMWMPRGSRPTTPPPNDARRTSPSDTIVVGLLSFASTDGAVASGVYRQLRDAFARWPRVRVLDSVSASPKAPWADLRAAGVSVALVIEPAEARSASITLRVRELGRDDNLNGVQLGASSTLSDDAVRQIVMRVIGGPAASIDSAPGLASLAEPNREALAAYVRGWTFIRAGALDSAARAFRDASGAAARFPHATLWLAQVMAWSAAATPEQWKVEADRAVASASALPAVDSLAALALGRMSARDYPAACALYRAAIDRDPSAFAAWFGLGECQRLDPVVVNDTRSATRLRFRSSYVSALDAYAQALDRIPSPTLGAIFQGAARSTYATTQSFRRGRIGSTTGAPVAAFPSVVNDSVTFLPIPDAEFARSASRALPSTYMLAIRKGRESLLRFSERWASRAHHSASAHLGRALALELTGEFGSGDAADTAAPSAMASLVRARRYATKASDSLSVFIAATRVQLRRGDFAGAARTADSALHGALVRPADVASRLSPLAALVGNDSLVAQLEQRAVRVREGSSDGLPDWLAERYAATLAAVAVGRCEGLEAKLASVDSGLVTHFAPSERPRVRARWLSPIARIAVPCLGTRVASQLDSTIPFDRAVQRVSRRDLTGARATLDTLAQLRQGANAAAIAWDAIYEESWVLAQIGDSTHARARLDAGLNDLAGLSEYAIDAVPPVVGLRNAVRDRAVRDRAVRDNATRGVRDTLWVVRARALRVPSAR